jgi:aspartyl-tRNA synthetase
MTTTIAPSPLRATPRTLMCGEPRETNIGQSLTLKGWVYRRRDLGGIIFLDLRDRTGVVQLRLDPDNVAAEAFAAAGHIRAEFCFAARGVLQRRPAGTENDKLATGLVELVVSDFEVLATSKALPFQLDEFDHTNEEVRLRYRFLDLRRDELQRNLLMRHRAAKATRDFLANEGFLEIETPILTKATPEGARDFLVPSRLEAGSFYALPQSPQLFKQLLMMSGYDRYYQIARCFRDEDLRANRQPEFTQIDIEMSFVGIEDLLPVMERLVASIWRDCMNVEIPLPLPRMTYAHAMAKYGSDKPDLRFDLPIVDLTGALRKGCNFQVFNDIIKKGGVVRSLCLKGKAEALSNTDLRPESKFSSRINRDCGIRAYAWFKVGATGELESNIAKFFDAEAHEAIKKAVGAEPGDVIFLVAGPQAKAVSEQAGRLRLLLGREFDLIDKSKWAFTWVLDFPAFEWNAEEKRWDPLHHPFTSFRDEDMDKLGTDRMGEIIANAYDLALNGEELGGGSIRINRSEVQEKALHAIGITPEEAQQKFGFLLEALQYGAPPHGGIAFGFDRLIMLLTGEENIRQVMAFPKTATGACLLTGAPSPVPDSQLRDVHIQTRAVVAEKKAE